MRLNFISCAAGSVFLMGFTACSPPDPGDGESGFSERRLVVALKPDKDPDRMLEEKRSLEDHLSTQIGVPVEVFSPLSGSVIQEGFANGTIDLAYVSGTDMVHARERGVADLLLVGEIDGKTSYTSYWVTLRDKPYEGIEDLRGRPIAFSSRTSTSGYVIPLWDLYRKGLIDAETGPAGFFGEGNVFYGSGYVSAVNRVLDGEAEAAAVSFYVLEEDRHLTGEQRDRLRKMAEQGPVPTHVIAVRASLADGDKERLRDALLVLNDDEHHDLRDAVFTSRIVAADEDEHLAGISEAMALARRMPAR